MSKIIDYFDSIRGMRRVGLVIIICAFVPVIVRYTAYDAYLFAGINDKVAIILSVIITITAWIFLAFWGSDDIAEINLEICKREAKRRAERWRDINNA